MSQVKLKPVKHHWGTWSNRSEVMVMHKVSREWKGAWVNNLFAVQISLEASTWGTIEHLWVSPRNKQPMIWSDMQRIKNELCGPDRVAVEVYPDQDDVVDQANMYHLWVLPPGFCIPFGLHGSY